VYAYQLGGVRVSFRGCMASSGLFITLLLLLLKKLLVYIEEDCIIINYTNSKLPKIK
jgi:hypothetical protein